MNMKKGAVWALIIVAFIIFWGTREKNQENKEPKTLKIGNVALNIEVADTNIEREQGLSGREGLEENEGLLFVFGKEGNYGIWMKDMNFPIDIAWLDKDKKLVHIESNVSPSTYPDVFKAGSSSLYVLETNAGFFEKNGIEIGYNAEF